MPRLLPACLAVLAFAATPALAADDDTKVLKVVDGELVKEILEDEGYKGIQVLDPPKGEKGVDSLLYKIDGKKVLVLVHKTEGELVCRFSVGNTNATLRKINTWNESKKFFKAFLDKDGDPVFDHLLVTKHGVTKKAVTSHIMLMEPGVKAFLKEVCD